MLEAKVERKNIKGYKYKGYLTKGDTQNYQGRLKVSQNSERNWTHELETKHYN